MGERKWTDEQLSAIESRGKTLLVSAAAGSGKTATLTERIIRKLTDTDEPIGIDSLLVVTFTNAAASELRAKISKALGEAVAKNPENKHLERQLFMLPSAKIRTIDSFCNDILRANVDRVGIAPGYRIADGAECELLASSILEGMIDAVYSGIMPEVSDPESFDKLADCLTDSKRTEELSDVFRYIYDKCDSAESGVESLGALIEKYNPQDFVSVEKTEHGMALLADTREMLMHYENTVSGFCHSLSRTNKYE